MKIIAIIFLMIFPSIYSAEKKYSTTKQAMNEIFQAFIKLLPYTYDEMKFNDPNSESEILKNLNKLNNSFKNAKHLSKLKSPGFAPSYEVMKDHLQHTVDSFSSHNKMFARLRLKSTTNLCMSCHGQISHNYKVSSSFKIINNVSRSDFNNDFQYAEFLSLIRNYKQAIQYYEKEIDGRIEKNKELKKLSPKLINSNLEVNIEKSLNRIFSIYYRVYFNPQKATEAYLKFKKQDGIPPKMIESIAQWIKIGDEFKKKGFTGDLRNIKETKAFIKTYLESMSEEELWSENYLPKLIISAGALYRFVNKYPKSEITPDILYWLGKIDYKLSHNYFYSLGDIYLKQCISQYINNPTAKRCLEAYEDQLTFNFTGTAGTDIPAEELRELNRLKSLFKKK